MEAATHTMDARFTIMTSPIEISELYERHWEKVYRTALRVTGNPADAEDALQTVFLRLLNMTGRLDPSDMPEAYFRRAATNAAIDLLRRRIAHAESPLDDASLRAGAESPVLLKEQLRRALAKLEAGDAAIFLLRYVEGLSNGELAEMFGQEKNAVAVRLHRIRQALQAEMMRE